MPTNPEPQVDQAVTEMPIVENGKKADDVEKKLQVAKAKNAKLNEKILALGRKKAARVLEKDEKMISNLRKKIDNI